MTIKKTHYKMYKVKKRMSAKVIMFSMILAILGGNVVGTVDLSLRKWYEI